MSEFEKHWEIQRAFPVFIKDNEEVCKRVAKEAWKAALEFIKNNYDIGYDEYDEYDKPTGIRCIWLDDLNKELEQL